MLRRLLVTLLALLATACGQSGGNPFSATSPSHPPSANAAIMFVSGSWSGQPGQPRELLAIGLDGSAPEQLTSCSREPTPCDLLQVAPSPDRNRVVVVRTTPTAEPGADALYFMDLNRSVEQVILSKRRVESADWSADGSFLLYSGPTTQTTNQDLFTSAPDGTNEQNLTNSLDVRERFSRIDPFARTAVYERICTVVSDTCTDPGVSRIYLYSATALTSGPATGPALPGTPYLVGSDASPTFSPDGSQVLFRRLTGVGNGGLGTWDLMTVPSAGGTPVTLVSGPLYRGAPDWSGTGIVFVETDAATGTSELVLIQPDGSLRTVLHAEAAGFQMGSPRWLH
jgi:Tol biopolymer transport system component